MEPEAIAFGLATLAALALTLRGSRLSQACAWALVIVYAAANLLWETYAMDWLPLVDLPAAMAFYVVMLARPCGWTLMLAVAFGFRMPMHVAHEWGLIPLESYLLWIDAAFVAALIAVSWEGGIHAIRDSLRHLRGLRDAWRARVPAFTCDRA